MLRVLLWKDYRLQRVALAAALSIIIMPYGYTTYQYLGHAAEGSSLTAGIPANLEQAGRISLMASLLVVAMLAGAAFATERSDRSSEFLAVLPSSRLTILASKVLWVMVPTGTLWLLNPYVIMWIAPIFHVGSASLMASGDVMLEAVSAMALSVLGTGWLGSILVTNPASSLLMGLLSPFACSLLAYGICDPTRDEAGFRFIFVCSCLVLGAGCLIGGTVYYLRRERA